MKKLKTKSSGNCDKISLDTSSQAINYLSHGRHQSRPSRRRYFRATFFFARAWLSKCLQQAQDPSKNISTNPMELIANFPNLAQEIARIKHSVLIAKQIPNSDQRRAELERLRNVALHVSQPFIDAVRIRHPDIIKVIFHILRSKHQRRVRADNPDNYTSDSISP